MSSHHSTAAAACGGFDAERPAGQEILIDSAGSRAPGSNGEPASNETERMEGGGGTTCKWMERTGGSLLLREAEGSEGRREGTERKRREFPPAK